MSEAINAANDADLKERFENALRKHMPQMVNEDFGVTFDRSNKFHTSLYNDFLEVYFSKCGALRLDKKKELVASVLRELAKDITGSANGAPSYLNEAEKIQPELSVDDLAKAEKGHKEIPVEVAGNERDIESVNRAIRAIESRIADTIQKKLKMLTLCMLELHLIEEKMVLEALELSKRGDRNDKRSTRLNHQQLGVHRVHQ